MCIAVDLAYFKHPRKGVRSKEGGWGWQPEIHGMLLNIAPDLSVGKQPPCHGQDNGREHALSQ